MYSNLTILHALLKRYILRSRAVIQVILCYIRYEMVHAQKIDVIYACAFSKKTKSSVVLLNVSYVHLFISGCKRDVKADKISQISVQNKYDKASHSGKASFLAARIEKHSGKEKLTLSRSQRKN